MAKMYVLIYQAKYAQSEVVKRIVAPTFLKAHEKAQSIVKKLYNVRIKSITETLEDVEVAK